MQRLFIIALAFCVTLAAALGALLYVSLIPHFIQIGWAATGLLILGIICAAALLVAFTFTRISIMLSHRQQKKLLSRVIVAGEVVAAIAPNGDVIHLSAMHVAAGVPRMLPAPKEEELIADDKTVIEMYNSGNTYETIMEQCNLKYNKVQRIVSEAKKRGEITK